MLALVSALPCELLLGIKDSSSIILKPDDIKLIRKIQSSLSHLADTLSSSPRYGVAAVHTTWRILQKS
jgi:hypothetical protein